jgi:hypothetical protein
VITKATVTTERRLMSDLEVVKDAYDKREIEMFGFIRTTSNPADALTKVCCDLAHLSWAYSNIWAN